MNRTFLERVESYLVVLVILTLTTTACAPNIERLMEKGDVEKLIEALSYERSPEVRAEAALALGELGESEAMHPLLALLSDDEDETVRSAAAEALGQICYTNTVPSLIDALEDESDLVRESAKTALVMCGAVAEHSLIKALESDESDFRQSVVEVLSRMGSEVSSLLVTLLRGSDENASSGAYDALVLMGSPAIPDLIDSISSDDVAQSLMILDILVSIGADSVDALIELLDSNESNIAGWAMVGLAQIGDPSIEPLIESLVDLDKKSRALAVLLEIGDSAIEPLIGALSDSDLQIPAGDVLIAMGEPAIDPLIEAYEADPDNLEEYLRPLVYGLLSDDEDVRSKVEDAILLLGAEGVPPIIEMVKDSNKVIFRGEAILASEVSNSPYGTTEGLLVDGGMCTTIGEWEGMIVLCERGDNYFVEKVENVQESGSIGVIHFNSFEGNMYPYLGDDNEALIVSVGISQEEGLYLLEEAVGESVQISSRDTSGAFDILAEFGEMAIPDIIEAIKDPAVQDTSTFYFFEDVLVEMGSIAVPPIIELLEDENADLRYYAAYLLREFDDDLVVEPLIAALEDSDSWVRYIAAGSLGDLQAVDAVEPLVDLLSDEDEYVHDSALDALASIGMPAVDFLLGAYYDETTTDKDSIASALKGVFKENADAIAEVAVSVCSGEALPDAAEYNRYEGEYHPTIILDEDGDVDSWTYDLPVDWLPFTPEMLQLVVCLGEEEKQSIQVCQYYYTGSGGAAPSITRYRYEQDAALYVAFTGYQLGSTILKGSQPDACPWSTSSSTTTIYGNYVGVSALATWLSMYGIPLED